MNALMTLDDIAEMYNVSRRYARDILVKQPDFPALARGSTPRKPMWVRAKVLEYARGQTEEV